MDLIIVAVMDWRLASVFRDVAWIFPMVLCISATWSRIVMLEGLAYFQSDGALLCGRGCDLSYFLLQLIQHDSILHWTLDENPHLHRCGIEIRVGEEDGLFA